VLEAEAVEVGHVVDAAEVDLEVVAVMILARQKGMLDIHRDAGNTTSYSTRTTVDGNPIDMAAAVATENGGTEMTSDEIGVEVATSIETRGGLTEGPNGGGPVRGVRMIPGTETEKEIGGIGTGDSLGVVDETPSITIVWTYRMKAASK
jgi:hypothetical protein